LENEKSVIVDAKLSRLQDKEKKGESLTLSLSFKIQGNIREVFDQKNWERAYNIHDNVFRINIEISLKEGRKAILQNKLVRKAILFWTRSPKIPFRIWVSIIKDDTPFYPTTVEEAKSLLFDINKFIELNGYDLKRGSHEFSTDIKVSWGKHYYTDPTVITGRSNAVTIIRSE
jgi:nitroimidazol reductase NimA-like FMN-containing flavoprotein (pyridoxamine 5'-phosphate oxidase superfamily)